MEPFAIIDNPDVPGFEIKIFKDLAGMRCEATYHKDCVATYVSNEVMETDWFDDSIKKLANHAQWSGFGDLCVELLAFSEAKAITDNGYFVRLKEIV